MNVRGLIILLLGLMLVASVVPVRQIKAAPDGCHKINATLFGETLIPPDCPSPVGICGRGLVVGGGLLNGTEQGTLLGLAPTAGLGAPVPSSTFSYVEEIVFTTGHGTLTARAVGIIDATANKVTSLSSVVSGTGRFAGATGFLYANGEFTDPLHSEVNLIGEICLAQ